MRHSFLLVLFLLAPLAPLYSAQEPPTAARIAELRSNAEQGDAVAQYRLGYLYADGQGVAQDYFETRKWWLKAAAQGHAVAQYRLGVLYADGQGGTQDYVEARNWFLKAALQGNADAQVAIGSLYYLGKDDIAQDFVEFYAWFLKAAEQGDARAQFGLGNLYSHGEVVAQDYTMAYVWLNLAASQRDTNLIETKVAINMAADARDAVAAKLDAALLAEAQKLSDEYFNLYVEPFQ